MTDRDNDGLRSLTGWTVITPEQLAEARRGLGQQLAARRETAGLTQLQLARLAGYSRSTIANVETGRSGQPRDCWVRYDELLRADGALLSGHDHYRGLVSRHKHQAAQERERLRTAIIDQWRHTHALAKDAGTSVLVELSTKRDLSIGEARLDHRSSPVDQGLCAHWYDMLRVLAATDNALSVHGLLDIVRNGIALIHRNRRAADGPLRLKMAAVEARWLEFGSWVAHNQQQPGTAGRWLQTARSLAEEAGDQVHVAYVQMRLAQQAVEAADAAGCAALAEPVMRDSALPPRVRALAAVRYAQALAHERDVAGVRASLGMAYHLVDQASQAEDPAVTAMAGHGTSAYLRGYEAHCRLLLGETEAAANDLQLVLTEWPATQRLDEGLFRANLAVALARSGDLEAADSEAAAARTLGIQTGSRRTLILLDELAGQTSGRRLGDEVRTR